MLVVFTTVPNAEEGAALAEKLVEKRLAACVQVLPGMTSFYVWEGAVQSEPEHLLLIKTLDERWDAVRDFLTENHSYTVPEIVAVKAERISGPYSEWLRSVVG
jgi:periplasmic divalent cation tolerance protein